MSQEPENFDALRKLLAVKRHEQPPPGYFEQFSSEVMARLRAGEHRQANVWQDLGDEASWLQRVLGLFSAKPALAGAFGVLMCGVVLTGVYFSQKTEADVAGMQPAFADLNTHMNPGALALSPEQVKPADSSSTNGVLSPSLNAVPGTTLFDQIGVNGKTAPVSLNLGGQ